MKNYLLLITYYLLLSTYYCFAQAPTIMWQKSYGSSTDDAPHAITKTVDGGYLAIGGTFSSDGDVKGLKGIENYWLIKISATDSLLWQKCLGGSWADEGWSVIQTKDSNIVLAGYASSIDSDVVGNHGGVNDYWVVKLTPNGTIIWKKCFGSSQDDEACTVVETADGNYVVAGYTNWGDSDVNNKRFPTRGDLDYWIIKLTPAGKVIWKKCYGGSGNEFTYSMVATKDGGIIAAGDATSTDYDVTGFHSGGYDDCWIVKIDSSGAIQWENCFGGSGYERAQGIIQTKNGEYVFTGFTNSTDGDVSGKHGGPDGYDDAWVVRLDATGKLLWQKCIGGNKDEDGWGIIETADNNLIIGITTNSTDSGVVGNHGDNDILLAQLSSTGKLQWQKCYGGSDYDAFYQIANGMVQPNDSELVFNAISASTDGDVSGNHGGYDFWIVKLHLYKYVDTASGVEEIKAMNAGLNIYPNPANANLTISRFDNEPIKNIEVLDVVGRQMNIQYSISNNQYSIDVQGLAKGIYFLKATDAQGNVKNGKFVKQ